MAGENVDGRENSGGEEVRPLCESKTRLQQVCN